MSETSSFDLLAERSKLLSGGFLRVGDFVGPGKAIPVSRSTWYAMVRSGKAPSPVALGPRIAAYPVEAIKAFIESFHAHGGKSNG